MELLLAINEKINDFVWGPVMLVLLIGCGLFFTIRSRGLQFRRFGYVMKTKLGSLFTGGAGKGIADGAVSPFQALTTALAGTIGTGNIVGVATALTTGGPGAIFWMWVSALVGMMTKYAEIVLSVQYRQKTSAGEWKGGPMYYIEQGLHLKWLAVLFGIFAFITTFGTGNLTQINAIATSMQTTFHIPPLATGIVVALLIGFVIIGGIKRIGRITEKVVPLMSLFYVIGAVIVLIINRAAILPSLSSIFACAFTPAAAAGGFLGAGVMKAIQMGMARGIFSNEAGLGTAPIAHAAADTEQPVEQGLWGIFEVFMDTILVCTCTALIILTSGLWTTGVEGANLTMAAFAQALPAAGNLMITIALFFFALSTMLGWSYYGEKCFEYLFGERFVMIYRVAFIIVTVLGSLIELKVVWAVSDTLNGLMAIPNLIGLIGLSGVVIKLTRDYFGEKL